jgi:hypothetical protein
MKTEKKRLCRKQKNCATSAENVKHAGHALKTKEQNAYMHTKKIRKMHANKMHARCQRGKTKKWGGGKCLKAEAAMPVR